MQLLVRDSIFAQLKSHVCQQFKYLVFFAVRSRDISLSHFSQPGGYFEQAPLGDAQGLGHADAFVISE
jgi:hypothetical protein